MFCSNGLKCLVVESSMRYRHLVKTLAYVCSYVCMYIGAKSMRTWPPIHHTYVQAICIGC